MTMTFDEWLKYGVDNQFCSEQFCDTHDGPSLSESEDVLFSNGNDPCIHVVRLGTEEEWETEAKAQLELE